MGSRGYGTILGAALALALLSCSPALAAPESREIGRTAAVDASGNNVAVPVVQDNTAATSPSYRVPFDGVITEWYYGKPTVVALADVEFYVVAAYDSTPTYYVRSRTIEQSAANGRLNFDARVPVEQNDIIGIHGRNTGPAGAAIDTYAGQSGDHVRQLNNTTTPPGSSVGASSFQNSFLVNVAATVESDEDGDGYGDVTQDNCVGTFNDPQTNTDGDAQGDACDADDDNDGTVDGADAFPLSAAEQRDTDFDGTGDNADGDDDNDGAPDDVDAFPRDASEVRDTDTDGRGDNADEDDDNDGVADRLEALRGTSPVDVDSDDDGLSDADERRTDPTRADSDRDGLPDGRELGVTAPVADPPGAALGTAFEAFAADADPRSKTNPLKKDTDRDGLSDGREDRNRNGKRERRETDPRKRDTDRDRIPDGRDRKPLKRGR